MSSLGDDGDVLPPDEADYVPPADDSPPNMPPVSTRERRLPRKASPRESDMPTTSQLPNESFARKLSVSPASGASPLVSELIPTQQRQSKVTHIRRAKGLHYMELSLQASIHHGATDAPLLPSQTQTTLHCVASSLAAAGCTRSLLHLQRVLPKPLLPKEVNPQTVSDFLTLLDSRAAQVGRAKDTDSMWPTDPLMQKTSSLITVDDRSKAQGATAETLVERLIAIETDPPALRGKPKVNYTSIFLFTYHLFMPTEYLFAILARMIVTCQAEAGITIGDARALHLQRRAISVLGWLVTHRWSDLTRDVAGRLEAFATSLPLRFALSSEIQRGLINLATMCRTQLAQNTVPCSRRVESAMSVELQVPNMPLDANVSSFLDVEDVELARQISLLSFSLFERIRLRELEHSGWTHDQLRYTTTNLVGFVNYTEKFTRWVAWAIVSCPDPDMRRLIYRKMLRLARYLYDLQNFTMLSAVYLAIDHNAVTRLAASRNALPKDEEDALDAIKAAMDPFSSMLKEIPHTISSASIPLMGPYLSVMSRLEEGHSTVVLGPSNTRMVNWSKMAELGTTLIQFASFQSLPYPFVAIPNIQRFLWVMPGVTDDDSIMRLSKANES